jgi:putative protein-disulfide isomerase
MPAEPPRLLVFEDAMCSWCYGFQPELERFLAGPAAGLEVLVQAGGLRPFSTEVMTEAEKPRFRGYREQVAAASGRPFDWRFFERDGFVLDTEPASRAVVTVRSLMPEAALPYLHALSEAFFARDTDLKDEAALADIAAGFGVDGGAFLAAFRSDEAKEATLDDFRLARRFGVNGFPTLVLLAGDRAMALAVGYTTADDLGRRLSAALAAAA